MARDPWSRPARDMAREMALAGVGRDAIRDAVSEWASADEIRHRAVLATWADKITADAMSSVIGKATPFRPRASTEGGRSPVRPVAQRPSELLDDWQRYLASTSGIAERRPYVYEATNALQQGLGLWPELDEPGGSVEILTKLGWTAERIALVLGTDEEAAAA